MFKVVHIQKDLFSAGRSATRLHNSFLESGIDSSILSLQMDKNDTGEIKSVGRNSRLFARVDYNIQSYIGRKIDEKYGMYSFPVMGTNITKFPVVQNADVIYIHWALGGFLNLSNYRQLAKTGKPVIIFMHDMWTITGGCHHSFNCEKYTILCTGCPMFSNGALINWPLMEFRKKSKIYRDFDNLYFVSPSRWLLECARKSALTKGKPLFHIPNIIDNRLFRPIDKKVARQVLNLNQDETIIAFGAFSVLSPYKGWPELEKALKILSKIQEFKSVSVLIFGGEYNKAIADSIPFRTRFLGFLKDEYSTVLVYNAADVFVSPSLADNLPTTVLESLSCGTPVTGFDVGGIPDMIDHRKNGYLAKYRDSEDLANGIRFCLENRIEGSLLPEFLRENIIGKHFALLEKIKSDNQRSGNEGKLPGRKE